MSERKRRFDIILTGFGEKKLSVIKIIRELTGLDVRGAKDFVEGVPKPVREGISEEEATTMKKRIENAGGSIQIEERGPTPREVKGQSSRIVQKAHDKEGENWFDYWSAIDEDLHFVRSSLEVIGGYSLQNDDTYLCPLIDDLKARVDRAQEKLEKLNEKHRLGPFQNHSGEI